MTFYRVNSTQTALIKYEGYLMVGKDASRQSCLARWTDGWIDRR